MTRYEEFHYRLKEKERELMVEMNFEMRFYLTFESSELSSMRSVLIDSLDPAPMVQQVEQSPIFRKWM